MKLRTTEMPDVRDQQQVPKAQAGNSWLAAWKTPEVRGEMDELTGRTPLLARAQFTVWKLVEEAVSPRGLGAARLYTTTLPLPCQNYDPGGLAAFLGNSMAIGSATHLTAADVFQMVKLLPSRYAVREEAAKLESVLGSLDSLFASNYRPEARYESDPGWRWKLIVPGNEPYGRIWVPSGQAEQLIPAIPREASPLDATHTLCDVLGTKHAVMASRGLEQFVERDKIRIQRWQQQGAQ